ncbi:MAG: NAD(P)-dependent alcohol dehydrogenase [Limosilactobacillus sp.]
MLIKAAVANQDAQELDIKDVELDAPKKNEVLVKIVATGICHTDKAAMDGMTTPLPAVLGHEGAGIVEKVGADVTSVKPGDHVALSFSYCGECRNCRAGHPGMCMKFNQLNFAGASFDGTHRLHDGDQNLSTFFGQSSFANYVVAEENNVVKVPEDMDLRLLGPLGCGIQTGAGTVLNYIKLRAGETIVIYGMGPVGLSAVMAAKVAGAKEIIAVDRNDNKMAMAKEMGATLTLDSSHDDVEGEIGKLLPDGVDYSLDTTGNAGVIKQAVRLLRPAGECVLIGIGGKVEFDIMQDLLAESKKIAGVVEGDSIPQEFLPKLIKYYQEGKFPFDKMIKLYDFADINAAFNDFINDKTMKPVVVMDKGYQVPQPMASKH